MRKSSRLSALLAGGFAAFMLTACADMPAAQNVGATNLPAGTYPVAPVGSWPTAPAIAGQPYRK